MKNWLNKQLFIKNLTGSEKVIYCECDVAESNEHWTLRALVINVRNFYLHKLILKCDFALCLPGALFFYKLL